jgi:succinate-acetate transporter protein
VWSVWNFFFLIGSLPINLVYIGIFFTVQMAFTLVSAGYFLLADGHTATAKVVNITGGAFAFASGMLGYYTVANLMCSEALNFSFPMGDTSHFFRKKEALGNHQTGHDSTTSDKGTASQSS